MVIRNEINAEVARARVKHARNMKSQRDIVLSEVMEQVTEAANEGEEEITCFLQELTPPQYIAICKEMHRRGFLAEIVRTGDPIEPVEGISVSWREES